MAEGSLSRDDQCAEYVRSTISDFGSSCSDGQTILREWGIMAQRVVLTITSLVLVAIVGCTSHPAAHHLQTSPSQTLSSSPASSTLAADVRRVGFVKTPAGSLGAAFGLGSLWVVANPPGHAGVLLRVDP